MHMLANTHFYAFDARHTVISVKYRGFIDWASALTKSWVRCLDISDTDPSDVGLLYSGPPRRLSASSCNSTLHVPARAGLMMKRMWAQSAWVPKIRLDAAVIACQLSEERGGAVMFVNWFNNHSPQIPRRYLACPLARKTRRLLTDPQAARSSRSTTEEPRQCSLQPRAVRWLRGTRPAQAISLPSPFGGLATQNVPVSVPRRWLQHLR